MCSTAEFYVKATGVGLEYQWQRNINGNWVDSNYTGNRTRCLKVPANTSTDGYKFRCVITDANGVKTYTTSAILRVR